MDFFRSIAQYLYNLTLGYGVIGLGVGTFLESLGIPTASAVLDLTAGLLIIEGRTTFIEALIIADFGLVLGSLMSYYAGQATTGVLSRLRRTNPDQKQHQSWARKFIDRYGEKAIFFGQLFGPARTWISFPAGAMGMDIKKFIVYTALGGAVYCSIIILISLYFTRIIKQRYEQILSMVTIPVFVGFVFLIILLILSWRWISNRFIRR